MPGSADNDERVVPDTFPIKIGLVCFGGRIRADIGRMARNLNGVGDAFQYTYVKEKIAFPNKYTKPHCYSNEQYFAALQKANNVFDIEIDYWIGFTHDKLEEDKFNTHDHNAGYGMITTNDIEKYKPIGMASEQYLSFLCLCESFCLVGKNHYEHKEVTYDLFDECGEKADLTECLNEPYISHTSRKKLDASGFKNDAGEAILGYVKEKSPYEVAKKVFSYRPVMLGTGIVIGQITQLLPKSTSGWTHFLIALSIALGIAGYIGWTWYNSKKR